MISPVKYPGLAVELKRLLNLQWSLKNNDGKK
jgi:hypothetical protein